MDYVKKLYPGSLDLKSSRLSTQVFQKNKPTSCCAATPTISFKCPNPSPCRADLPMLSRANRARFGQLCRLLKPVPRGTGQWGSWVLSKLWMYLSFFEVLLVFFYQTKIFCLFVLDTVRRLWKSTTWRVILINWRTSLSNSPRNS